MKKDKDIIEAVADRRSFLKLAGATAAASGAAVVPVVAQAQEAEQKPGQMYRETEHVRRYYELAR